MVAPPIAQLALAFAIVKSKPSGVTLQGYLDVLTHDLVLHSGLQPEKYWQSQCARLRIEVRRLEQECATLRAHEGATDTPKQAPTHLGTGKRTAESNGERPQKRPRLEATSTNDTSVRGMSTTGIHLTALPVPMRAHGGTARQFEIDAVLTSTAAALSAHVGSLRIYQQRSVIEVEELCLRLSHTLSSLKDLLLDLRYESSIGSGEHADIVTPEQATVVTEHIRAAARVFSLTIQAFDHIDLYRPDSAQVANATFQLAEVFSITMLALESHIKQRLPLIQPSTAVRRAKIGHRRVTEVTLPAEQIEIAFRQLLISMVSALNPTKQNHAGVHEALVYWLIHNLGTTMRFLTGVDEPLPNDKPGVSVESEQTRIYGTHLLAVLQVALERAPRGLRVATTRRKHHVSQSSTQGEMRLEPRHSLIPSALARMQRTLVKIVLGDLLPLDEAADCIDAPTGPQAQVQTNAKKGKKGAATDINPVETLQLDVFKCLGWEILAYEGKLAEFIAEADE